MNDWSFLTDHIPTGKMDAIPAEDLAKLLDIDKRSLRQTVEEARRASILICGDEHGYYFAADSTEMAAYIHRVRGRIRTGCACLAPFLRQIRKAEVS